MPSLRCQAEPGFRPCDTALRPPATKGKQEAQLPQRYCASAVITPVKVIQGH